MEKIGEESYILFLKEIDKEILNSFNCLAASSMSVYLNSFYSMSKDDPKKVLINFCADVSAYEEAHTSFKDFISSDNNVAICYAELSSNLKKATCNNVDLAKSYYDSDFVQYSSACKRLKYLMRWNRLIRSNKTSVMAHSFIVAFLCLYFSFLERGNLEKNNNGFTPIDLVERGLFHDLPEALTGDIISPVKAKLNSLLTEGDLVKSIETEMIEDFKSKINVNIKNALTSKGLLADFYDGKTKVLFSIDSLAKECDRIALLVECLFELKRGTFIQEMKDEFQRTLSVLLNSEWPSVRDFCHLLKDELPV